jgi:undecaprenyl-diphosphatase
MGLIRRILPLVLLGLLFCSVALAQPTSRPTATSPSTAPAVEPDQAEKDAAPKSLVHTINLKHAIVLGVVEGLTEYLPVSSTGHLILASHKMDLSERSEQSGPLGPKINKNPAIDAFEVVIQIGAILAVLGLYHKQVRLMLAGIFRGNREGRRLLGLLGVAFLPAAVVGVLFHDMIQEYLFSPFTVAGALIVGGMAMIGIEHFAWRKKGRDTGRVGPMQNLHYWQALLIGLAQCLAMWPGTSRSMVTILAGVCVGLSMVTAAEFSFLLALPTLGGATVYSMCKDFGALQDAAGWDVLLVGVIVSGLAAALAVKAFVKWLTKHGMVPFAVYRILIGLAVFAYFLLKF